MMQPGDKITIIFEDEIMVASIDDCVKHATPDEHEPRHAMEIASIDGYSTVIRATQIKSIPRNGG